VIRPTLYAWPRPSFGGDCRALAIWAALLLGLAGCRPASTSLPALDQATCDFGIYWPPRAPAPETSAPRRPLLTGALTLTTHVLAGGETEARLVISVTRPSTAADRDFWNTALAFPDLDWMEEVRVWDADHRWLWPNLAYLLRLPGRERVERYGGMDPAKQVDNDFAAVLIRKFDAQGRHESAQTQAAPLVSAEWHAAGTFPAERESLVHTARSDVFVLHLGGEGQSAAGRIKVWLIYADFLGSRPPRNWPKEREWAGGILAYFEIDWETSPGGGCRGVVRQLPPPESTHFDWQKWAVRTPGANHTEARSRLRDDP